MREVRNPNRDKNSHCEGVDTGLAVCFGMGFKPLPPQQPLSSSETVPVPLVLAAERVSSSVFL